MMKRMKIVIACFTVFIVAACAGGSASRVSDTDLEQYRNLLAEDDVKGVVNRLFISTDNRDWESVKSVFASEVLFDMTSMVGGEPVTMKPSDIVAAWDKGLKAIKAIHHQIGNYVINVEQNSADVFCYGIASHYLPNKTHRNTRTFVGSYNFHLVKNGANWQIDRFKFNLKYIDGNMNLEGS